jgi:hypothetical protein
VSGSAMTRGSLPVKRKWVVERISRNVAGNAGSTAAPPRHAEDDNDEQVTPFTFSLDQAARVNRLAGWVDGVDSA